MCSFVPVSYLQLWRLVDFSLDVPEVENSRKYFVSLIITIF